MLGSRRVSRATVAVVAGAVLAVGAVPAGAAGAPTVVFSESTSSVSYSVLAPPEPVQADADTRSGYQSYVRLMDEVASAQGQATADVWQRTVNKHGPTDDGYTLRKISLTGSLAGVAALTDQTGGPVSTEGTADSLTKFTVNSAVPYAFNGPGRSAGHEEADPDDCSLASVTLKRGVTVVFRKTVATAGCPAGQPNVGTDGGELAPGDYTLESHLESEARALNKDNSEVTRHMAASVSTALTLGIGKTCNNVLPTTDKTITGTSGNDVLCGGPGADTLKGYAGNDTIYGAGSGDSIFGGGGADVIKPGGGRDSVAAGGGSDSVNACDGLKDTLGGGRGSDSVRRDGVDVLSSFETKTRC